MKKDSLVDYLGYLTLKVAGPLVRILPLRFVFFLGSCIGELLYYFNFKGKAVAYANIKSVFGNKLSPYQLSMLTKDFFKRFGQNLIEVLLIPLVDEEYIRKYISFEGLHYIQEAFQKGRGVIFLGIHAGSWELSNVICANLRFSFSIFVRNQRHPLMDRFLNHYRTQKGCRIIKRTNYLREIIQLLKANQAIGMTLDQGGKKGIQVKFFGKDASMATGAIRLALKYDATILPGFYTRVSGPYLKVIIGAPFKLIKTGNLQQDIKENLKRIVNIFEGFIMRYPKEYLWTYKIYKYSSQRDILVLSDAKAGHLSQAMALAKLTKDILDKKGINVNIEIKPVRFKNRFSSLALILSSCLAGKYSCQGCLWCLRRFLDKDTYKDLTRNRFDMIISCGSRLAPINFVLSRENLAKSVVILKPGVLSTKRFDLVIMPYHDRYPKRKNIVFTDGALNLIDEQYLKTQKEQLLKIFSINKEIKFNIGLLIGGNTKNFCLSKEDVFKVIKGLKSSAERLNAGLLITTSRRTSREIEDLLKEEFKDYPRCQLMVIVNEKNFPFALGGILALSEIIVISPESISMISEAVNSQKPVLVFYSSGLDKKHYRFLKHFVEHNYISLIKPEDLEERVIRVYKERPPALPLKDNLLLEEAIKRIL
ncbi:MAG: mitochondrial fission ELM1 family protein [Candidatus Omnitrophica bacterium]|nr:mitochondrial fission ELM1 family protein [Candidatus Omnitrophota bacterium]